MRGFAESASRGRRTSRSVLGASSAAILTISTLGTASAQTAPAKPGFPITTDRPSFSDGTLIVPRGRINLETGYTFFEASGTRTQTFPETLLRIPMSDRWEVRLVNLTYADVSGGTSARGLLDPQLGFKYKLANGVAGRRPDLALIGLATVPAGARAFRVDAPQPTAKLAWYYQATAADGFGGNFVASFLGPDRRFTQFAASLYGSRTLSSSTGAFAEVYRLMPVSSGGPDAGFFDAGVTYLLNPATQLDLRVGTGFDRSRDGAFVGAGVSFRF